MTNKEEAAKPLPLLSWRNHMKHFLSLAAALIMLSTLLSTSTPAEARGGCQRGGARFCGSPVHGFGGCIRTPGTFRRGPICGPNFPRYRYPRYGYPGYGYGRPGIWSGGYLPCYDGGSPYICDIKQPPPPPPPVYIYQGGTVVREYGAARAPGMSPVIINEYKSSAGAKPQVIAK